MSGLRLRPVTREDLPLLAALHTEEADPFNWFGPRSEERADPPEVTEDKGSLAVEADGTLLGSLSWHAVQHGPTRACRALNIGISLLPEHRGRGHGAAAQRLLADHLFGTQVVERLEASTDVDNVAEQRALEKAGFRREGVLRHAQHRQGSWHDLVLYSRLRGDA